MSGRYFDLWVLRVRDICGNGMIGYPKDSHPLVNDSVHLQCNIESARN